MIKITQREAEILKQADREHDIHVHNKTHKKRAKTYYLTTSKESMHILNQYREKTTNI